MTAPKCLRKGHDWFLLTGREFLPSRDISEVVIMCRRCEKYVTCMPVES